MENLKLTLDGTVIDLSTEDYVSKAIDYLQAYKNQLQMQRLLLSHAKHVESVNPQFGPVTASTVFRKGIPVTRGGKRNETPQGNRLIDWIERVWITLGCPAQGVTGEEYFEKAKSLGYKSTALNPKTAFKTSIRFHPRMKRVGETNAREALWVLLPESDIKNQSKLEI